MEFEFESELIEWRGPAPFVFAVIPQEESEAIRTLAKKASYGWGCITVSARIGETEFTTAIIPKDGRFRLPVKRAVQASEKIGIGDRASVWMAIRMGF